ncbi:hypothetical protein ONS96_005294 [Cadophora gregata f. sp. sojae]|nr:hypothetical protein ONS96_005294 [Cadophora gregata f. sp. sojae]
MMAGLNSHPTEAFKTVARRIIPLRQNVAPRRSPFNGTWFDQTNLSRSTRELILRLAQQDYQERLIRSLATVPRSLLVLRSPIHGPDIEMVTLLSIVQVMSGQKVVGICRNTGKVDQVTRQALILCPSTEYLIVRLYSAEEKHIALSCDPNSVLRFAVQPTLDGHRYDFDLGMASAICKVGGLIETQNLVLLAIRSRFPQLETIMRTPLLARTALQKEELEALVAFVWNDVLREANMILMMMYGSAPFWANRARLQADIIVLYDMLGIRSDLWNPNRQALVACLYYHAPTFTYLRDVHPFLREFASSHPSAYIYECNMVTGFARTGGRSNSTSASSSSHSSLPELVRIASQ